MSQVTSEKKVFHIVPGGHTDPITGTDCKWNVFRVCNTTTMDAAARSPGAGQAVRQEVVLHHAGLRLRPHAAGRLRQEPEEGRRRVRRRHAADRHHRILRHADQGQGVQAERAAEQHGRPGADRLHEAVRAVRHGARTWRSAARCSSWRASSRCRRRRRPAGGTMEWWWDQPNVPEVAQVRRRHSARRWARRPPRATGSAMSRCIRCGSPPRRRSRWKGRSWRMAMEDMELPPDVALQPGKVRYRAGDHELMPNIFVGQVHPPRRQSGQRVQGRGAGAGRAGGRHRRRHRLQDDPPGC